MFHPRSLSVRIIPFLRLWQPSRGQPAHRRRSSSRPLRPRQKISSEHQLQRLRNQRRLRKLWRPRQYRSHQWRLWRPLWRSLWTRRQPPSRWPPRALLHPQEVRPVRREHQKQRQQRPSRRSRRWRFVLPRTALAQCRSRFLGAPIV